MDEPEPATIRAAMGGDVVAFEAIVRHYQVPVWRFLRQLLGDPELAEDVTQETFLRLFRRLPSFAFEAKFSTWTFQVARNAGIDALRSRARQDRIAAALATRPLPSSGTPGLGAEVDAAVASLSPKLREALLVVEVLGLTYREAAHVLGIPEGTMKSRVFQARAQLAAWLEVGEGDGAR